MLEMAGQNKFELPKYKKKWQVKLSVVSKHFIEDIALGREGVATEGRTSQLGGSDGMLVENFELLDSIYS